MGLGAADKPALREHFKRLRKEFVQTRDRQSSEIEIWKRLVALVGEATDGRMGAAYRSYGSEVSLEGLWPLLNGCAMAFPRVEGHQLQFYLPESFSDFIKSRGVLEPQPEKAKPVGLDDCDFILVPGLAFDQRGGRLGHGAGFYDRALENYQGLKVGVCFSVQTSAEALPADDHDVFMDLIVTEENILELNKEKAAGL